ncbi:hypothetical protein J6590_010462 [Homalodisca vitripennis]|nr:hypothetical protein J6590_010462 [Homalodisca vitripennis]
MIEEEANKIESVVDVKSKIGVFVTADVHIIRYSEQLSENTSEPTLTVETNLNTTIKDASNVQNRSDNTSEKYENKTDIDPSHVEEVFNQPAVRKSKKGTKINDSTNLKAQFCVNRVEIDRTILLPYLGCTAKQDFFQADRKSSSGKSSRSLETITTFLNKMETKATLRTRSFTRTSWKKESADRGKVRDINTLPIDQLSSIVATDNFTEPSIRRQKHVRDSRSPLDDRKKYQHKPDELIEDGSSKQDVLLDKILFIKNIQKFDDEIHKQFPCSYSKATRNVSILHRPRMRNQATSTSSLNKIEQDPDQPSKGPVVPYVAISKNFPSELVLNLVPKKEALEISKKDIKGNMNNNKDSQDLLTPVVNVAARKKKKKLHLFRKCFPLTKNKIGNRSSDESLNKEIYYPSVVEIHDKKSTKSPRENDSDILSAGSIVYSGKRKKA